METNQIFAERLQSLRERKRLSRRTLAELCGMNRSTISRYERGEREPKLSEVIMLAEFFGVSVGWLAGTEK